MKKRAKSYILFLFIMLFLVPDIIAGGNLIIRNARLIDGTEAQMREGISILIRDGRIARIGNSISMKGIPELDVQGSYVLPGLIDGHVHLMWGPGAMENRPEILNSTTWEKTWGKYLPHYLRAYLACGVKTVLDVSAPIFVIQKIREHLSKGNPGPRFLSLGEMFAPPKGYGSSKTNKPVSTPQEVEIKLDAMQSLKVIGNKISIERG